MRVALVHDYLNQRGGAERVFSHIASAYPDAPVYTALFDAEATGDLVEAARVRTSFIQRLPKQYFRYYAPLYPRAFEGFDLSAYDLVLSSTSAWAKGVRVPKHALHICYIHSVSRFVFAYDTYVGALAGGARAGAIVRPAVNRLIAWDRRAAARPSLYLANSRTTASRVTQYYSRSAEVLHPPVDVDRFTIGEGGGDYFLVVSRLLPYKRIDLAIEASSLAGVRLIVVGQGPAEAQLKTLAAGTNTEFAGALPDRELASLFSGARAVVVPGEEDYGLVPLEANAAGRPAIAFGAGGALETIRPGVTGEYFSEATPASLAAVLRDFDPARYEPSILRGHAERHRPERFIERLRSIVDRALERRAAS